LAYKSKRFYRKEAIANGYRSKFELEIAKWLEQEGVKFVYEPCKIDYIVPESKHKYTPDWQINGDNTIYWESKGNLTARDRAKLIHIKESNPNLIIRVLHMNSKVKISRVSITSFGDWCEKQGFEWCDWKDKKKLKGWIK
jgi:hypothetical protein